MSEFEEKIDVQGEINAEGKIVVADIEDIEDEDIEDASIVSEVDNILSDNEGPEDDVDFEQDDEEPPEYEDYDVDGNELIKNNAEINSNDTDDDDDDDDDDYEQDLRKFENIERNDYVENYHQTVIEHNDQEVKALTTIIRDKNNNVIDDLHKTIPILTKYEKARILGLRASQINSGSQIFVKPKMKTFDGYLIAIQELEEKKIPFIIKRPLPMGGGCEYWKLNDLEVI